MTEADREKVHRQFKVLADQLQALRPARKTDEYGDHDYYGTEEECFDSFVRDACRDLLATAKCDGWGGCRLCRS